MDWKRWRDLRGETPNACGHCGSHGCRSVVALRVGSDGLLGKKVLLVFNGNAQEGSRASQANGQATTFQHGPPSTLCWPVRQQLSGTNKRNTSSVTVRLWNGHHKPKKTHSRATPPATAHPTTV